MHVQLQQDLICKSASDYKLPIPIRLHLSLSLIYVILCKIYTHTFYYGTFLKDFKKIPTEMSLKSFLKCFFLITNVFHIINHKAYKFAMFVEERERWKEKEIRVREREREQCILIRVHHP